MITDKDFPSSFESVVKKIIRLLYHVLAHIYHSHFKEIVLLNLHSHLNCIFAHLVLFNDKFKLMEDKEVEVLHDLAIALKLFPPLITENVSTSSHDMSSEAEQHFVNSAIIDNNNGVITTQCRSISPLVEANTKCANIIQQNVIQQNVIKLKDDSESALSAYQVPLNPTDKWINVKNFNAAPNESICDKNSRRSISASAILLSSSDPSIPTTISRRCNSDRTSGRNAIYRTTARGSICGMNTAPLFAACGSSSYKFQ